MSHMLLPGRDSRHTLACGLDHACGFFLQVFDEHASDADKPIVDIDTANPFGRRVSRGQIIEEIERYGCPGHPKIIEACSRIAADLDPMTEPEPTTEELEALYAEQRDPEPDFDE